MASLFQKVYATVKPTYHNDKDAAYLLPNDSVEHSRLDEQAQHLSAIMNNQIVHAPIEPDSVDVRVLDVGCGTGAATDYLASRFKGGLIYGLDLTPIPVERLKAKNVHFLQGNFLTQNPEQWVAPDGTHPLTSSEAQFDFVFCRLLICGLTNWPEYIKSVFDCLKPGGYMEVHDLDWRWYDRSNADLSDSWQWASKFRTEAEKKRLNLDCGSKAQQWMRESGFSEITVREYELPWYTEGNETPELQALGRYLLLSMPDVYSHAISKMMDGSSASSEEIHSMQDDMVKDFQPQEGKHWKFFVTTGRKPLPK